MEYSDFFKKAYGKETEENFAPYDYQEKLAKEPWPDLLDIPTGMGKTAAVTLAWLWKRGWRINNREQTSNKSTPRRLVWCLPMRVLVEQTESNIRNWLENLGIDGKPGEQKVSVHLLMGGEPVLKTWAEYPEEDMILIGTQDMLLSRALMRGYGMSRYQWPIHFALLHNDCLWAYDEVQLMGAGLATSAQLDAFRRSFPLARNSRTLWVSATLNRDWLATVDMKPNLSSLTSRSISDQDREQAGERLSAMKSLRKADVAFTKDTNNKQGLADYLNDLCKLVLKNHDENSQTLVIVNRVDRAQQLFRRLREQRKNKSDLLIHSRFRAKERAAQAQRLREDSRQDRIIVATQAIEAGVDISSKALITELAPWASMAQRFGRCNRYGEYNKVGASIYWIDIEEDADALPYTSESLTHACNKLESLTSASAQDLPATDEAKPLTAVLRRKDLLDLFNTDPDLSGFDIDISDYIRDTGNPGVQVFWRDFKDDPNLPEPQGKPARNELCPVSIGQARDFAKRKDVTLWYWDTLDRQWTKLTREPRPGMTLLASAADGGYEENVGFDASLKKPPVPTHCPDNQQENDAYAEDWRSRQNKPIALADHLGHVAEHAEILCTNVDESAYKYNIVRAGRWHDLGKLHKVFQHSMYHCKDAVGSPLAKTDCPGPMWHERNFFRHELASMLGWLSQHDSEPDADLIAYLILAHHGKVRMSLRAIPGEEADKDIKRFARGVWEGDELTALDFDGEHSSETTLKLALMEIGYGEQGPSWTERSLKLLDEHGPFRLAWLETLVRLADWRASAAEQQEDKNE